MNSNRPVTPPSDDESLNSGAGLSAFVASTGGDQDSPMADAPSHPAVFAGEDSDDEGEEENNNNNNNNNAGTSTMASNTTNPTSRRQTRGKQGPGGGGGGGGAVKKLASGFSAGVGKALGGNWGGSKGKGRADREEPAGGLGFSSGGGFETRDLRGGGGGGGREEREKLVDEDEMEALNRDIGDPFDESDLVELSRNPLQPSTSTVAAAPSAPTPPPAPTSALSPSSQPTVAPVA